MPFSIPVANIPDRFLINASPGDGGRYLTAPGSAFPDKSISFAAGTTAGQVNKAYITTYAITNGGTTAVDLKTCMYAGTTQAFTAVKFLKVSLATTTTADTDPVAVIGPQGVANSAILCFGATTGVQEVRQRYENSNVVQGWAVTNTNKVIQFGNNGLYPINLSVMVLGVG